MSRPPARGRILPTAAVFAALAAALVGCDHGASVPQDPGRATPGAAASGSALELIVREPDGRHEQPGVVRVDPLAGWGRRSGAGWDRRPEIGAGGEAQVWTDGPRSVVLLPILEARGRRIVVDVMDRVAGEPVGVEFRLDGATIGAVEVDEVPVQLAFDVPAASWRNDPTRLEVLVARTEKALRGQQDGGRVRRGLALGQVRYAEERPVRWNGESGLVLTGGTHARYGLERDASDARRLTVRGSVRGGGGVLELALVDRRGSVMAHEPFGPRDRRDLAGTGAFEFALDPVVDLGAGSRRDVALRIGWEGDGEVAITSLELQRERDASNPPIVFVSIDTLAARSLGLYGYTRDTSPNLDAFAAECVVFENCRANTTWTAPSYISQFTGTLPHANRVLEADVARALPLWDERLVARERWTLAEALRARGYRTGAVVANTWLALTRGIARGFDHFDSEPSQHQLGDPPAQAPAVFERALGWLDEDDRRPPFAFVQVLDVHGPYLAGDGWRGRFGSGETSAERDLVVVGGRAMVARSVRAGQTMALGTVAESGERVSATRMRAAYDENLAEFDDDFGRFVRELRRRPWFDDAWIVVSADHGEAQDEPAFVFDHIYPDADVLRVPLLVRPPGGADGRRVSVPVALVDLYPTILEAAGLDPRGRGSDGRSLVATISGSAVEERDDAERAIAIQDGALGSRAIVRGRWKLVEYPLDRMPPEALMSHAPAHARWAAFAPGVARRATAAGIGPDAIGELWSRYDDPLVEMPELGPIAVSLARFYASSPGHLQQLYDLDADPSTLRDVAAEHPDVVRALASQLRASLAEHEALRPSLAEHEEGSTGRAGVDDAALERLVELGYIDGK